MKTYSLSVKAIVTAQRDRCLLLRRSSASTVNPGLWDLPGGKVKLSESFEESLVREIREETGLMVTLDRLVGAAESELPQVRVVHLVMAAYVDSPNEPLPAVKLSEEHSQYAWMEKTRVADVELCPGTRPLVLLWAESHSEDGN